MILPLVMKLSQYISVLPFFSRYQLQPQICALFMESTIVMFDLDNLRSIRELTYDTAKYVHQGWFSEDHRFLYTTDELDEQVSCPFSLFCCWYVSQGYVYVGFSYCLRLSYHSQSETIHFSLSSTLVRNDGDSTGIDLHLGSFRYGSR